MTNFSLQELFHKRHGFYPILRRQYDGWHIQLVHGKMLHIGQTAQEAQIWIERTVTSLLLAQIAQAERAEQRPASAVLQDVARCLANERDIGPKLKKEILDRYQGL